MNFREIIQPRFERPITRTCEWLRDQGFTPNQLTVASMAVNLIAGLLFAAGLFFPGTLVLIAAGMGDVLDGALARITGKMTKFGAFLDSTLDRYSDLFNFGGLAVYFARTDQYLEVMLVIGIIGGAFVTSYAKARAENYIEKLNVGLFDRFVRIFLLVLGTLIPVLLLPVVWILFFGCNATAVHRILHTNKLLNQVTPDETPEG